MRLQITTLHALLRITTLVLIFMLYRVSPEAYRALEHYRASPEAYGAVEQSPLNRDFLGLCR